MQPKDEQTTDPIKPDLKHDSMEFSAATEGDDLLDLDNETAQEIEDEEITSEELDLLEEDDADIQAKALISAESDSQSDEDNFLTEPNIEEDFDDVVDDGEDEDNVRK
ncbi:MAG: hypothetical protein ABIN94_18735 [Ferruginibacter sp.]